MKSKKGTKKAKAKRWRGESIDVANVIELRQALRDVIAVLDRKPGESWGVPEIQKLKRAREIAAQL